MTVACWVCESREHDPFRAGGYEGRLTASDLKITDHRYGLGADMVRCRGCGFVYASPLPTGDLVALYTDLDDPDYAAGHAYRLQQMEHLLGQVIARAPAIRSVLDVGAGTGLMVEAARRRGLSSEGVEPSHRAVADAQRRGIALHQGLHPHPALATRTFDLVTAVDVIEHVTDPLGLLRSLAASLSPDGWLVVTTPDVDSIAARLLPRRWWHFRLAHVSFVSPRAMAVAAERVGLRLVARERQRWWFPIDYLARRVVQLVPGRPALHRLVPHWLGRVVVPINLYDSWVYYCRLANTRL